MDISPMLYQGKNIKVFW